MPDFSNWFFDGWSPVLRIVVVALCAYVGLVVLLRISGKRTLSKMNAFDFVVTVALGSTLATIILSKDVSILAGVTALAMLIGLQWIVAWTCAHSGTADHIVKSEPTIILWRGQILHDVIRRERLSIEEVRAAIRTSGKGRIEEIAAIVMETTGDLSIISELPSTKDATALPRLPSGQPIDP